MTVKDDFQEPNIEQRWQQYLVTKVNFITTLSNQVWILLLYEGDGGDACDHDNIKDGDDDFLLCMGGGQDGEEHWGEGE